MVDSGYGARQSGSRTCTPNHSSRTVISWRGHPIPKKMGHDLLGEQYAKQLCFDEEEELEGVKHVHSFKKLLSYHTEFLV